MTKKDFVALAAAIRSARPTNNDPSAYGAWSDTMWAVVRVCKAASPRFDVERFTDACAQ